MNWSNNGANVMVLFRFAALSGVLMAAALAAAPAHALTMKECSAKYAAAKDANKLGGVTWNEFRKTECGSGTAAAAEPAKPAKKTNTAAAAEPVKPAKKTNTAAAPVVEPAKPAKKTLAAAAAPANKVEAKGLSMADCSAKYKSAQESGLSLKWNDFRKAECGPGADPVALSTDGTQEPAAPSIPAPKGVSFPRTVSAKFSSEAPAKARMHTCLEQYYANKQNNSLGGLRWIQKGGGYYSLCNAKLKG